MRWRPTYFKASLTNLSGEGTSQVGFLNFERLETWLYQRNESMLWRREERNKKGARVRDTTNTEWMEGSAGSYREKSKRFSVTKKWAEKCDLRISTLEQNRSKNSRSDVAIIGENRLSQDLKGGKIFIFVQSWRSQCFFGPLLGTKSGYFFGVHVG